MYQIVRIRFNRCFRLPRKFDCYSLIRFSSTDCSSENTQEFRENHYKKYVTCTALILSGLGAYYLYTTNRNKVHAFSLQNVKTTQNIPECGEFLSHLKTYSAEEVSKHDNKEKGIWVTYREGVYDITDFVEKHPGGPGKVLMAAGSSIEPFWKIFANHKQPDIYSLLESMRIGNLDKKDVYEEGKNESDPYENDPTRHSVLKVHGSKPFCAEPPASILGNSYHTPAEYFYVRNHLPVPEIDSENYELELAIEQDTKKILKLQDLKKYPKHAVTSTIMCGGNRRSEMAQVKPLKGLSWEIGAVGNAEWSGARLCDVLKDLGFDENSYSHVQFEGVDTDPSGTPYGVSIPMSKAMNPKSDVLLAYEMNGQPLTRDHGFPVRVVVPGVVGARNVKWIAKIIVSKEESASQWQQGDYKGFSSSVDWDNVDFKMAPAIQNLPITSAICSPQKNEKVYMKNGTIPVKGYAYSGGGNKIIRVDVTADEGKTWHGARLILDPKVEDGRSWGWALWEINLPIDSSKRDIEIWAKAVDSSYNVQPEGFSHIWNLRGLLSNAWMRVPVTLSE